MYRYLKHGGEALFTGDECKLAEFLRNRGTLLPADTECYEKTGSYTYGSPHSFWNEFFFLNGYPALLALVSPHQVQQQQQPPPKVAMLGGSGSGKTCFLAAMYNVMETGVQSWTLSTPDLDQGAALNEVYQTLRQEEGDARWPKGTSQSTVFRLELNRHYQKLAAFDWLDYRGGALRDKAAEADVKALLQYLTESFAILIAIDGEILEKSPDELGTEHALGINRINQFLRMVADAAHAARRKPPMVCLVVTKGDAIIEGDEASRKARIEAVKQLYHGLTMEDSGWDVHIMAVSLGEGLHLDRKRAIRPIAVHEPVCCIARRWFEGVLAREEMSTSACRQTLREWLAFAERHKDVNGLNQEKMREFVSTVNARIEAFETPLASLRQHIKMLQPLCGQVEPSQGSPAAV